MRRRRVEEAPRLVKTRFGRSLEFPALKRRQAIGDIVIRVTYS
jgi:hypothetical protein